MADFRPSQVYLGPVPLGATMRKSETEYAAALLVYACVKLGDQWQPVAIRELGRIIKDALDCGEEPVATWASNPFMRPDLEALWLDGYAELVGEAPEQTIAFTEKGLDAVRQWVQKGTANG